MLNNYSFFENALVCYYCGLTVPLCMKSNSKPVVLQTVSPSKIHHLFWLVILMIVLFNKRQ